MSNKVSTRDVAALRRALDTERFAAKSAQQHNAQLQQALDSERSAVRALRREISAQVRTAKEEENRKHASIIDELKCRIALGQSEAIEASKEEISRALISDFQRIMHARQEEWRRQTKKQLDILKEQVKEAQRVHNTEPVQTEKEAIIRSLNTEFKKTLHSKQEEWKQEMTNITNALNSQLKETQLMYEEAVTKLTAITNEAEQAHKLRHEIICLKERNKQLDDRVQVLMESERRKTDEFRCQRDDYEKRLLELQRAARKETHQILEEMKGKDRVIMNLEKELQQLVTRLDAQRNYNTRSRFNSESSCRSRAEGERPKDSPRLSVKRLKSLTCVPELIKEENELSETVLNKIDNEETINTKKIKEDLTDQVKDIGLEMLYKSLCEEHQELRRSYLVLLNRLQEEQQSESLVVEQFQECDCTGTDTISDMAMAEQIHLLRQRLAELEMETQELREHNDLLEFRLMELDDGISSNCSSSLHYKSPLSRSPDTREIIDVDDVSDSGVMSLPTSEDISESDLQDNKMELNNRDIKSRLSQMCQTMDNVVDRISIQQALSLLRHYEGKLESLEATLAAMCHEPTMGRQRDIPSKKPKLADDTTKSPCRIIATVLPFTDLSPNYEKKLKEDFSLKKFLRDADCLQESGIFDESGDNPDVSCTQGTQTDWSLDKLDPPPGDLGAEIRKLTQIRERIEEQGGNKKLLRAPIVVNDVIKHGSLKEIAFYKERLEILESKIAIYESNGNEQTKKLSSRLEREVLLGAEVKQLKGTVRKLQEEKKRLEEEKCEYEEAENDTRLRCQKLEVKLSALGEKKSDLQVQLQQSARTMANLRSTLAEEERKHNEAHQQSARMENLINQYEQRNFELEEREMEVTYHLQMLENTLPALIIWYVWHIMNAIKPYLTHTHTLNCANIGRNANFVHSSCIEMFADETQKDWSCGFKTLESKQVIKSTKESKSTHKNFHNNIKELKSHVKEQCTNSSYNQNVNLSESTEYIINDLSTKCQGLENKIKQLEEKEKEYNRALQNSDELWEKMENSLKLQLQETEEELLRKQTELNKKENQIKKLAGNSEIELQLNERLMQLDQEVSELHDLLNQREKEKKSLVEENQRLYQELETYIDKLHSFKTNIEIPLQEELGQQSKKYKEIQIELELQEKERKTDDELHDTEVNELKKHLRTSNKELEENEVTISELKEEVQTLERAVTELRNSLTEEREYKERLKIEVGTELEAKDLEIKMLREINMENQTLDIEIAESLKYYEGNDNSLTTKRNKQDKKMSNTSKIMMHAPWRNSEAEFQVELESTMDVAASTIPLTHDIVMNCPTCETATCFELRTLLNHIQWSDTVAQMKPLPKNVTLRPVDTVSVSTTRVISPQMTNLL